MYSKSARAQRVRKKAADAKESALKAKIESFALKPLRELLHAKEEAIYERLLAHTTSVSEECANIQERIGSMEGRQREVIHDQVSAAMAARRKDIESTFSSQYSLLEKRERQLAAEVKESFEKMQGQNDRLKNEWKDFYGSTLRRLEHIETTIKGYRDNEKTLCKLSVEFTNFASAEEQRENVTRRLTALVKDLEDRNWPWRKFMDRSPSPGASQRDLAQERDIDSPIGKEPDDWKLWKAGTGFGPKSAQSAPGSAKPTPPSSRPASARYRRPSATAIDNKPAAIRPNSAGGNSSAGGNRSKHDRLPPSS